MYFVADVNVTMNEATHFEWALFISAGNYTQATGLIEIKVRERWPMVQQINEISLQAIPPEDWMVEMATPFGDVSAVLSEIAPRQLVRGGPKSAAQWWSRLINFRKK